MGDDDRGMSNAKEELDDGSSTDGRASRKCGHHLMGARILLSLLFETKRLDEDELSPPVSQSVSTKWSQLVGNVTSGGVEAKVFWREVERLKVKEVKSRLGAKRR